MLTEYESIIIIDGEAADRIISGGVKTYTVQKSSACGFAENSFVRNSAVLQCISPAVNDGAGKVKFSVVYRPAASLNFDYAAVMFSTQLECRFEVRCGSETMATEEGVFSGFRISLSETEGKLELEFLKPEENRTEEIRQALNEIKSENSSAESEIAVLEQQLLDENSKSESFLSRKNEISEKIILLKNETEKMSSDMNELSALEQKKEVLERNFAESEFNAEKLTGMKYQLEKYDEILDYYKYEDGFISVKEKINQLVSEIHRVEEDIALLAQKRSEEN